MRMDGCMEAVLLCMLILWNVCCGVYIPNSYPTQPKAEVVVNKLCPYDCTCSFELSYGLCQNGFSLSMLKDKSFMYGLKTLNIKRVEEVLLKVNFEKFTRLETFDLSGNVITTVPDYSFKKNTNLKKLSLTNNFIDSLSSTTFSTLTNLQELDLSHNNLHTLTPRLFDDLKNLQYLNLSMNAISSLPLGAFKELKKLQMLDLTSNNLVYLTAAMLSGLDSIQFINISQNYLASLSNSVVQMSDHVMEFIISRNNFDCSCELEPLIERIKKYPGKYGNTDDLICNGMFKLIQMGNVSMPCDPPLVHFISNSTDILARQSVLLQCQSLGKPAAINYWLSPWGTYFSHKTVQDVLESYNITATTSASYKGYSLGLVSEVKILEDGSLYIDSMRGYFTGRFTCVTLNGVGTTNATVDVGIYEALQDTYNWSLYISAGCTFLGLLTGIIIGSVSLCVQKCSCCCACCSCCNCAANSETVDKKFAYTIEYVDEIEEPKHSTLDSCNSHESYHSEDPPDTPFNSPIEQTPRASPRKCPTPNVENGDKSKSPNIKDTLDEVKVRLEKKMEKVRGHYNSIKESGSVYFSSIKDTAAGKVRAGVVSGMEQVKYGVKSIKEFCGSGDMGTQTISSLSFTPDAPLSSCTEDVKVTTTL